MATSVTGQLTGHDLLKLDSRGVKGELIRGVLCQHAITPRPWDSPSTEYPGLLTAEEFHRISQDGKRRELIAGTLFDTAPLDAEHLNAASNLESLLRRHVLSHRLGQIRTASTGVRTKRYPDTIRTPHILFVPASTPPSNLGPKKYIDSTPAWVCEIITPEDYQCAVFDKTEMWLSLGVKTVVEVYPAEKAVMVHRQRKPFVTLTENAALHGGDTIPGLKIQLNEIFNTQRSQG